MTEHSDTYWNDLLEQYRSGTINEEDQYKLEKKALDDPFLFDALEGFTTINEQEKEEPETKNRIFTIPRVAAAASIVFLVASVFLLKNNTPNNLPNQESIAMVLDKGEDKIEKTPKSEGLDKEAQKKLEKKPSQTVKKNSVENKKIIDSKSNLESTTTPQKPSTTTQNSDVIVSTQVPETEPVQIQDSGNNAESSIINEDVESDIDVATSENNENPIIENTTEPKIDISEQQSGEMADLNDNPPQRKKKAQKSEERSTVFYKVEPAIGIKDFEEYVKESIENRGLEQNPPLDVTIEFDIKSNGEITNFLHIFNGCPECGAYAIYLLSGSGVWNTIPKGQEGRARYTLTF